METVINVILAIILVGIIVLVGVGVLRILWSPKWTEQRPGATEILKERYARGEISREEYRSMNADLERV